MRTARFLSLAALAVGLANCANPQAPEPTEDKTDAVVEPGLAQATISDADGNAIGTVALSQAGETLSLEITIADMEPGQRAFHLHTSGKCEGPDFKSAGGHLNPFDKSHGKLSEDGKHLGDLPNISVSQGGVSISTVLEGEASKLLPIIFDEDGTAVMIHAGPDDYTTDPAGAAGPRIACGVLTRSS